MGGKSAPKAPDYEAAAAQQAQSSKEVTEQQTWANRPTQNTPFGQSSWQNKAEWDPTTNQYINRWTQNTTLNPTLQAALDEQQRVQLQRSRLAGDLTGRMQSEYGNAMDWSKLPQGGQGVQAGTVGPTNRYYDEAGNALYNRWAQRALPEQQRQTESMRSRLYNMGYKEGDTGFDQAMQRQQQQQSDAQQNAAFAATAGAGAEAQRYQGMDIGAGNYNFGQAMQASQYQNQLRQQALAEQMQQRGFSLNEMNALLSGQQVAMPNMPNFQGAQRAEGTQNLQAAQMTGQSALDAFNAQQQAQQGMMSGITSLAGGFMGMCDRRLKRDIKRLGKVRGVNIYSWEYVWGERSMGVMADEVPWAVVEHPSGFAMVDYGRVW